MNVNPSQPAPRRWPKVLIVSLALNLLFVGLVAGAMIARHRWGGPGGLSLGDPSLRGFLHSLPKERRDTIRAASDDLRPALRPLREAVFKARSDFNEAMDAPTLDAARIEAALATLIQTEAAARKAGIPLLTRAIGQMTPDERTRFQEFRRRHEPKPPMSGPEDGPPAERKP